MEKPKFIIFLQLANLLSVSTILKTLNFQSDIELVRYLELTLALSQ